MVIDAAPLAEDDAEGLKLFWFETVAVSPVALTHVGPTVVLAPETKLTAAHYCENVMSGQFQW